MMMGRPGISVALYLPRRSTIHSSPCGTMRTPFQTVMTAKISSAMTTISNPMFSPLRSGPAHLKEIALDLEHLHSLAGFDLRLGYGFPQFLAQHRFLKPDLAAVVRADVAGNDADLANQLPLRH